MAVVYKPRRNTTERGYGHEHQRIRKQFQALVFAGGARCVRCAQPISPTEPWDLGHVDGDRSRYSRAGASGV